MWGGNVCVRNLLRDLKVDLLCFQETNFMFCLVALCIVYGVVIM